MHKYGPVIRMLSLVTQIGITMLTSIFLCMFIGIWIDKKFSTNLFPLFLILGIMGGMRGVYALIRNMLEEDNMEEKNEK
ncbi:AtpZ/AtpI family protein [Anaerostipes sp. MSJ-23]|uniref:AtpZ/AtpI family protein n=1 Tax=unclassified Anaerostipes TaxID=2635253 RepID=UPI001C1043B6|nr:AtpZ/AtpI family protein [Anaerostipes sp. MSJ-23]MBU5459626.1 AtpZ/AtpI family protein [Anaerostipes sp. MSJ-23]